MKRILCLMLVCVLLCGCAPSVEPSDSPAPSVEPSETPTASPSPSDAPVDFCVSFVDSAENNVNVVAMPQNVAVLFSSYAEIWQLAGGTVAITVGEAVERGFADTEKLVDDSAGKKIDTELLLSYQPDLVIGSADIEGQVEAAEITRAAGIPTALFHVETFDDYLAMLQICTTITGEIELYESNGTAVAREIEDILEGTTVYDYRPSILFVRAGSTASTVKAKTADQHFAAAMLEELGAKNIADAAPILADGLSLEEVILQDPDYIFVTTMGDEEAAKSYMLELFATEGWKDLTAVKENRYVFLPKDLFHFKPNARWADAYRYLAELLYPDAVDA